TLLCKIKSEVGRCSSPRRPHVEEDAAHSSALIHWSGFTVNLLYAVPKNRISCASSAVRRLDDPDRNASLRRSSLIDRPDDVTRTTGMMSRVVISKLTTDSVSFGLHCPRRSEVSQATGAMPAQSFATASRGAYACSLRSYPVHRRRSACGPA